MVLLIAAPFIFSSFLVGKFINKDSTLTSYNNLAFINLTVLFLAFMLFNKDFSIINFIFLGAISLFYGASIINNKYLSKAIDFSGIILILSASYLVGFSINNIVILALLIACIYLAFNQSKANASFLCVTIFPVAISSLYLLDVNAYYIVLIMSFLGLIRFFIEAKTNHASSLFVNLFILLISFAILNQNQENLINSYIFICSGLSFILLSLIVNLFNLKKDILITRITNLNELTFVPIVKIFAFNCYAVALFAVFSFGYINIIVLSSAIILPLAIAYLKLLYHENEF